MRQRICSAAILSRPGTFAYPTRPSARAGSGHGSNVALTRVPTAEAGGVRRRPARLRDLPWRRTRIHGRSARQRGDAQPRPRSPGRTRWERFLDRWPTVTSRGRRPAPRPARRLEGLHLRRAPVPGCRPAPVWIDTDGFGPSTLPDLLALPGSVPTPHERSWPSPAGLLSGVVDTNIARSRPSGRARVDPSRPGASPTPGTPVIAWWNQVLMDLGATRCRPIPDCDGCPVDCPGGTPGSPIRIRRGLGPGCLGARLRSPGFPTGSCAVGARSPVGWAPIPASLERSLVGNTVDPQRLVAALGRASCATVSSWRTGTTFDLPPGRDPDRPRFRSSTRHVTPGVPYSCRPDWLAGTVPTTRGLVLNVTSTVCKCGSTPCSGEFALRGNTSRVVVL